MAAPLVNQSHGDEETAAREGPREVTICLPEATQSSNPEGQGNPRGARLAEFSHPLPYPSAEGGIREAPGVDPAHKVLSFLGFGRDFQSQRVEDDLGYLESRSMISIPERVGTNDEPHRPRRKLTYGSSFTSHAS